MRKHQIGTGINNATPDGITISIIPEFDLLINPPPAKTDTPFSIGGYFSALKVTNESNNSVSYSFNYRNARFILLDQFDKYAHYYYSTIPDQKSWIKAVDKYSACIFHKNALLL